MIRLGQEKPELGVIFDQIGTPTYARDLAVAIFAAINQGVVPGVYHFSNEGVISSFVPLFLRKICVICAICGKNFLRFP